MKKTFTHLIFCWIFAVSVALAQTPQRIRYEYDALNRLTRTTYPNSQTVIYSYDVLGNRTSVVVLGTSVNCPLPTATLAGSATIAAGQSAVLTVTLTESAPWALTLSNGQTYPNITSTPFTFSVLPGNTTTYYIQGVSNSCGTGTVNGSATVTITPSGSCTTMYTLRTGNWNDPSTWSCNRLPTSADVVQIGSGHIVTIPAGVTAIAQRLQDYGRLVFSTGSKLLLSVGSVGNPVDLTTGLLAWYAFNGNANDGSGNNNNGTVYGSMAYGTNRLGVANQAAVFDGVDDNVEVTDNNLLDLTNDLTFSVWLLTTGATAIQTIIGKHQPGQNNAGSYVYGLWFSNGVNKLDFQATPFFDGQISSNASINASQWVHVAFTYNKSTGVWKHYINGTIDRTGTRTFGIANTSINLLIGAMGLASSKSWFFRGSLDDLRIYNRTLTDSEIQALANQ